MGHETSVTRRGLLLTAGAAGAGLTGGRLLAADDPKPADGDVVIEVAEDLKVCQDRVLPPERLLEGLKAAKKEDPGNDVLRLLDADTARAPDDPAALGLDLRAVLFHYKKWAQNRALKVGFIGGTAAQRAKVQKYAELWHAVVNVRLKFGQPGPHEIRVAFNPAGGSFSYLGTDNLTIPAGQPTMNFGWVTGTSTEASDRAVILHEFGHALGMGHEHQSPAGNIQWNRQAVINAMWQQGWSAQQVEQQIFARYSATVTQFTAQDPKSIMMYAFPAAWTLNGFSTPWNTTLSPTDVAFMSARYPNKK